MSRFNMAELAQSLTKLRRLVQGEEKKMRSKVTEKPLEDWTFFGGGIERDSERLVQLTDGNFALQYYCHDWEDSHISNDLYVLVDRLQTERWPEMITILAGCKGG